MGMFGWGLRKSDEAFITPGTVAAGMLLAFLLSRGISQGKRASLALGVALLAIPGATVNPLTSGLSAIRTKRVALAFVISVFAVGTPLARASRRAVVPARDPGRAVPRAAGARARALARVHRHPARRRACRCLAL